MKKLLATLSFCLTPFLASADPYLAIQPAEKLEDGQSIGTYFGSWEMVIVDVNDDGVATVQSQDELTEAYGSLVAAIGAAKANTTAQADTAQFQSNGFAARILAEPQAAVSGVVLLDGFLNKLRETGQVESLTFIHPAEGLFIFQTKYDTESDVQIRTFARAMADNANPQMPAGLDSQIVSYDGTALSLVAAPLKTPTAEETLMELGPDPENTLVITLKDGDVVIRLRDDVAPQHTARLKELARDGFYNDIVFHRVIEGFMAQTGDPTGTGTSGSGQNLNAEFSDAPFLRGTVGMARAQSPNSADSQFFIMFADGRFLDNNYTVVGQVVTGMEFVDNIKRGEPPVDPDKMLKVQVQADAE